MATYILPLKAPTPLPATGVDIVTFKVWKNTLEAHLQQDAHHHHFMPGGLYSEWIAADQGRRITAIHNEDHDKLVLDGKRARQGDIEHAQGMANLLVSRNSQLAKFITHVATLCHHTENDDITTYSTSLNWIFDYLKKHYGLETKGANFMNISEHVFKKGTPYHTFYKQYRASFIDNLRKQGDIVKYRNNFVLPEDEKLSPSFENAIILWSLEKIDPRLPPKVKRNYGHQMTGDTTLKDIQPVIFDNIGNMLDELDQSQVTKAFAANLSTEDEETHLNAVSSRSFRRGKPSSSSLASRGARGQSSRNFTNKFASRGVPSKDKYCRICNLAGSEPRVYTSHEIGQCSRLSIRDLESLKSALALNGLLTLDEQVDDEPTCVLQPGWDDNQAVDVHQLEEQE